VDGRAAGSGSTALLLQLLRAWRLGPVVGLSNVLLPLLVQQQAGASGAHMSTPYFPVKQTAPPGFAPSTKIGILVTKRSTIKPCNPSARAIL
jgi:hypothetical protein